MRVQTRQMGPGMIQQIQSPCDKCKAKGEIVQEKDKCKGCKGKGTVRDKKILEVNGGGDIEKIGAARTTDGLS